MHNANDIKAFQHGYHFQPLQNVLIGFCSLADMGCREAQCVGTDFTYTDTVLGVIKQTWVWYSIYSEIQASCFLAVN